MARNIVNHIVTADRVQQLKQANQNGQLQQDDLHLLTQLNELIPSAVAPLNVADFSNKKAVGSFIDHVEKTLRAE